MSSEIVRRLRRKEQRLPPTGGASLSSDGKSTSYITDTGMRLVNLDGPEARRPGGTPMTLQAEQRDAVVGRVERRLNNAWSEHGYVTLTLSDVRAVLALAKQQSPVVDEGVTVRIAPATAQRLMDWSALHFTDSGWVIDLDIWKRSAEEANR